MGERDYVLKTESCFRGVMETLIHTKKIPASLSIKSFWKTQSTLEVFVIGLFLNGCVPLSDLGIGPADWAKFLPPTPSSFDGDVPTLYPQATSKPSPAALGKRRSFPRRPPRNPNANPVLNNDTHPQWATMPDLNYFPDLPPLPDLDPLPPMNYFLDGTAGYTVAPVHNPIKAKKSRPANGKGRHQKSRAVQRDPNSQRFLTPGRRSQSIESGLRDSF